MNYRDPFEDWWDSHVGDMEDQYLQEIAAIDEYQRLAEQDAMQDWWDIEDELLDEAQAEDDEIRLAKYENRRS